MFECVLELVSWAAIKEFVTLKVFLHHTSYCVEYDIRTYDHFESAMIFTQQQSLGYPNKPTGRYLKVMFHDLGRALWEWGPMTVYGYLQCPGAPLELSLSMENPYSMDINCRPSSDASRASFYYGGRAFYIPHYRISTNGRTLISRQWR